MINNVGPGFPEELENEEVEDTRGKVITNIFNLTLCGWAISNLMVMNTAVVPLTTAIAVGAVASVATLTAGVVTQIFFSLFMDQEELAKDREAAKAQSKEMKRELGVGTYFFSGVITAPLWEEMAFRGKIEPFLVKNVANLGTLQASVVTSIFFGAAHYFNHQNRASILQALSACGIGLGLSWIALNYGLVASIATHAFHNLTCVLVSHAGDSSDAEDCEAPFHDSGRRFA